MSALAGSGPDDAPVDPPVGAPGDLDASIDALYAGPPEQFVAARTALAKALRQQKRRDEAAAVQRLVRPALLAWAAGRTVAGEPARWAALLDAGAALLAAQGRAVEQADGRGVRPALLQRRQAVADLVAATRRWLDGEGRSVGDGRLDELNALFETASVDAEVAEALARGRLVRTPELTTGFDLLGGLEPAAAPAERPARPGPRPAPAPGIPDPDDAPADDPGAVDDRGDAGDPDPDPAALAEARRARAAAVAAATDELERAEARLRQATEAAAEADRKAADGERAVEELRRALDAAQRDARAHAAHREAAQAELDEAGAARREAHRRLEAINAASPAPRSSRRG